MIRAAERWWAIKLSEVERRQMRDVREELDREYEAANGLEAKTSAPARQVKNIQHRSDLTAKTHRNRALSVGGKTWYCLHSAGRRILIGA